MSPEYTLVLSRLAKSYRAGVLGCAATVEVLRGLSLKVGPSDLVTIEGPRAAGKTTLLLCAAGMLRPDEGDVWWPLLTPHQARPPAGIAYAADRAPMYGFLTLRESLAYAATVFELRDHRTAPEVDALLRLAALEDHADTRLGLLSVAERSRMIVALALIASPRLLLVDELGGANDIAGRAALAQMLARVAASGVAVVWAARAIGVVSEATAAYELVGGRLRGVVPSTPARPARISIELDVPAAGDAAALLAPRLSSLERRGDFVRVPLDGSSAEEVLALCRDLAIPVRGSRVVRDP